MCVHRRISIYRLNRFLYSCLLKKERELFVDVEIKPFEDKRGYICIENKVNERNQTNNTHAGRLCSDLTMSHIRSVTVACIVLLLLLSRKKKERKKESLVKFSSSSFFSLHV